MTSECYTIFTLQMIRKICKINGLKNYSGLSKSEAILLLVKHRANKIIQKWSRKILLSNRICPVSCEPIRFPYFVFKCSNVLIYYNICSIRNYIINTGDFRDPSTRSEYTNQQLLTIDQCYKRHVISQKYIKSILNISDCQHVYTPDNKEKELFSSVIKAYKNPKFYKKIKENENIVAMLETILDSICCDVVEFISDSKFGNIKPYIKEYKTQYDLLKTKNIERATYAIDKNIGMFTHMYEYKIYEINSEQYEATETVISNLYSFRD